jgi:hypothetical protein
LQFVEAVADVGAGDAKGGGDFLGWERTGRKEKKSVDLGDGAIDAPAGPHFAPMEDESLGNGREFFHTICYFCLNRNYRKSCHKSTEKSPAEMGQRNESTLVPPK